MMKQDIVAILFVLKRSCIMYHIHLESKNKTQFLCSESQVPFWQVKPQHFQLLLTGFFFFAHSCGVPASLGSARLSQTHTNTHKHIYIYIYMYLHTSFVCQCQMFSLRCKTLQLLKWIPSPSSSQSVYKTLAWAVADNYFRKELGLSPGLRSRTGNARWQRHLCNVLEAWSEYEVRRGHFWAEFP